MKRPQYFWHLTKRTWGSYRAKPLTKHEQEEITRILLPAEQELWNQFPVEDQRHSYVVMKRFQAAMPHLDNEELRAALLHDIGKIMAPLSTTMRVVATFVGPRTAAFREYHDHEKLGLLLLEGSSSPATIELLREMYEQEHLTGRGCDEIQDPVVRALVEADNV
jgi:hypothetical protein